MKDFIEPFKMNSMQLLSGRRYTTRSKICKRIWISGSIRITTNGTHQGKYCFGKTPIQTFFDAKELAKNKYLDNLQFSL
ncbi:hypothetical protein LEP1GSC040_2150 [Leptospira santarosai str. 2000030832]|nr:hypothetical protein LEP1GSC040_2150 [Leptospira santarosai str. 2000030832]